MSLKCIVKLATTLSFCTLVTSTVTAGDFQVSENDEKITIVTPQLEATVRKRGYVSGVAGGSFVDRKTGFRDAGFGLDIVDWIMEPGSDEAYRDELADHMIYRFNNAYHGKRAKRMIEGPQICTKAGQIETEVIRGKDFVAVRSWYVYKMAAPGKKTGSKWTQTIVFPAGKRYFISSDRIDSVNSSDAMFLRIDMPGHIKHKQGNTFSDVYLSYDTPFDRDAAEWIRGGEIRWHEQSQVISASSFFNDFPPDAAFNYRRDANDQEIPRRFIRAYRLKGAETGEEGPWLAGMTLDPSVVHEAWCHQRGYVCMIQEIGGRPVEAGESFGAAFVVGFFDSIDEMYEVYDQFKGNSGLVVDKQGWELIK